MRYSVNKERYEKIVEMYNRQRKVQEAAKEESEQIKALRGNGER